ncbi:MAG: alcohol dehydrogenase catalytic domain-containing protein [Pseudomonadota bacterium]
MKAMILERTGVIEPDTQPLRLVELPKPKPGPDEILVEVRTCGVCHTELDEIEGRAAPPTLPVIPGHEVVGYVIERGAKVERLALGARVGVGWIHHSSGSADENLSPAFRATGRDVDGGYAEFIKVPEAYAYPVPDAFSDAAAAPLLCAGGVGYRALRLTDIKNGQRLGLTGFGGSAHLVLQLARHLYPDSAISVFARDQASREFAREIGAEWAGAIEDRAPQPLDAIIDTTPAWKPVVEALANLKPGGRLVINAIRKEERDKDALLSLSYHDHLWLEKEIKSVANVTHRDLAAFLPLAAEARIAPEIETYPLAEANQALIDLKFRPVRGAKVLQIGQP